MIELEDDSTYEEVEALRMGPVMPRRKPTIVRKDGRPPIFANHGMASGRALAYYIDDAWCVVCPTCLFKCYDVAEADGGRLREYLCPRCANAAAGNRIFETVWPRLEYMAKVVRIVKRRPVENRHWEPGESLLMLVIDNVEHGCAVPEDAIR